MAREVTGFWENQQIEPVWRRWGRGLRSRRLAFTVLGWVLLGIGWQVASMSLHPLVVASPVETFGALMRMLSDAQFMSGHFWVTLRRVLQGVAIASVAGFALGVVAGVREDVKHLLDPLRWLLLSVPAVVVVVVAMLWFGMGDAMVVAIASLFLTPVVYIGTVEGMGALDEKILQMAKLYRFSPAMKVRHVYLPSVTAPLGSALVIVVCNGVRVAILAEVLGANEGIGYRLAYARTNLDVPELYACVLLSLGVVGALEFLLLRPIQKRLLRWRSCDR